MPRLNKIRISGNRYDGFTKGHENSIFDLSTTDYGNHTLFTLQNGSGKGVILQLISQIMLPGTSWGANNGNKLEGMFYDRYNVFKPYTFHVVLEWGLDGGEEKKLLAGICVSAHRIKNIDESEDKVGLKYFLYTHEYRGESKYSLENLPWYSKTGSSVLDYEQTESFIDENRQYIRKYSKTAVSSLNSDYYQYLASHGIYRSEWEIMKAINRSEGGLEKYFSKARDNQALFDKLIIPAVSESIRSRSESNENSLENMFIDNIKIAENLPELISRTEDINRLLQMVQPLLTDTEHGMKLKNTKELVRERGNNYLQALRVRLTFLQNELDRSKKEKAKTEAEVNELKYEKDNLKYAGKVRALQKLQQKLSVLESKMGKLKQKLNELQKKKVKINLNLIFLDYRNLQQEYSQKWERIKELKKSADISALREEMQDSRKKIKENWPELKNNLEKCRKDTTVYYNFLIKENKRLKHEKEEIENNIRQRERVIDRYQERCRKLEEWKEELSGCFNLLQLSTPEYLVQELSRKVEEEKLQLEKLQEKQEKLEKKIEKLKEKIGEFRIKFTRKESEYNRLKEIYLKRKSEEEKIFGQIVKYLELDKYKEVYNREWLSEKRMKLKVLLEEKEQKLKSLNNRVHELELDLNLNKGEYWIANHDQQRLYRAVKDLDIKVYYGSEFLMDISGDSDKYLEDFPLMPYGLILMYENDWEKVKKSLKAEEIFRSPVPVFVNYELENNNELQPFSFKLVHGKESEFITTPESFQKWYNGLNTEQKEIGRTISALEKKTKNIRRVIFSAVDLLEKKTSAVVLQEKEELEDEITGLKKRIDDFNSKQQDMEEEKIQLKKKINKCTDKLNNLKNDFSEVKEFAEELKSLEKRETEIEKLKEQCISFEEKLNANKNKQDENARIQPGLEVEYKNWLKDLQKFLAEMKELVLEVFDKFSIDSLSYEADRIFRKEDIEGREIGVEYNYPRFYDYRDSRVNYYFQKLMDLERKEEEKSLEIKYLRRETKRLRDEIIDREEQLTSIDSSWQEYSFDKSGKEKLKVNLKSIKKEITEKSKRFNEFEGKSKELTGEIRNQNRQIEELFAEIKNKYQKTARSWPEVDLKKKALQVNKSLKENKEYILELDKMTADYNEKAVEIQSLINKLDYYQLKADSGEVSTALNEKVRNNPLELVDGWVQDFKEIKMKLKDLKEKTEDDFHQFKSDVSELVENNILKTSINEKILQDFRSDHYQYNHEMLSSFTEYLHHELNRLDDNKTEAEKARNQWAERSAMHVMRIVTSLQEMISNMVYHNQRGHAFPLVRLRRRDIFPDNEEDIIPELREYFVEVIEEFNRKDIKVERLSNSELEEYTGDAALFSRAVRGRYPVLQVYKMTEKNEFLYAKPEDYFYADWEVVIQGKGNSPEGSGGQSLSINAFMMMMLLNYKKQRLDRSNPWTVLFLDNPFGKASAAHVLDPIFEIASKLNFQLLAFAAPEIIKSEISERFPVFWALEISDNEKGRSIVKGDVVYGGRLRRS